MALRVGYINPSASRPFKRQRHFGQGMTDQMRGTTEEVDVGVRGFASLNNSLTVQNIIPDFSLAPAQVDPERDVVITPGSSDVRYVQPIGGYRATGQKWSFETANLVRYRPGGLSFAGAAVRIPDDPPAGHLDIGLGGVPYQQYVDTGAFDKSNGEISLRLTSNGDWAFVIRRAGAETVIPRDPEAESWQGTPAEGRSWVPGSVSESGKTITDQAGDVSGRFWAFDACHGEGPGDGNRSGVDLDKRPLFVLPKLIGTWYGKGPYFLGFETAASGGFQRAYRAVGFEAEEQSISDRASLPLMVRYDDQGAGTSYTASVYGRQGSGAGELALQPKTPWNWQTGVSYGTGFQNASLLMAYRRAPEDTVVEDVNFRGTVFGILNLSLSASNRSIIFSSLDIDFGTQTPAWTTPTSVSDQEDTSLQVATQTTGGSSLTADPTTGTIQEATQVAGGGGGPNEGAAVIDPVQQPNARTKPLGIFAFGADQAVSDADLLSLFQEEGA